MKLRQRAGWAFAACLLVACAAGSDRSAGGPPERPAATGSVAGLERQLFDAVNAYRRDSGLPALRHDAAIAKAALRHSEAMAAGDVPFGHAGLRERAAAIAASVALAALSENIARHNRPLSEVLDAALGGWLASDAHRKNLRSDRELSGVGIAQSAEGTIYVTQIFVALQPGSDGARSP